MARPLPTYLRSHRRAWALTQRELAELLGDVSPSAISKYETLTRTPSLEVMVALEVVFGEPSHELFPALSHAVRRAVVLNATALVDRLAEKRDAKSVRKRRLLEDLIIRSQEDHGTNA
jgi:transcriptional regulator with XRE-family HTH domain